METVARGLRAASIFKGISCKALAQRAGVDFRIVRKYLIGKPESVRITELAKMCDVLGVEAGEIRAGTSPYGQYRGSLTGNCELSICWDCARSAATADKSCSWAGLGAGGKPRFEPVEGWKAIKRVYTYNAADNVETYMVVDCPEFLKEDERNEKDTDII